MGKDEKGGFFVDDDDDDDDDVEMTRKSVKSFSQAFSLGLLIALLGGLGSFSSFSSSFGSVRGM